MRIKGALSLKDFIRRREILTTYRELLKCARIIGTDAAEKEQLADEIKSQYRRNQYETDSLKLSMQQAEALMYLDQFRRAQGADRGSKTQGKRPTSSRPQRNNESNNGAKNGEEQGGWLGTGDSIDVRGRVGVSFPWQR